MQSLDELKRCFKVYAVCMGCARMESVSIEPLIQRFGGATRIDAVRERLRCQSCGQRTQDLRIVYVGPCEKSSGFSYRR